MVIQSNMSPSGIISAWPETKAIFIQFDINPDASDSIAQLAEDRRFSEDTLIQQLNRMIGSTSATCTSGG